MEYIVQKGDTLYGISKQYGVSVSELIDANNLSSTSLNIGDKLIIPRDDLMSYKVVKGDTFFMGNSEYIQIGDKL